MVGHTGVFECGSQGSRGGGQLRGQGGGEGSVDGRGTVLLTADHGNADRMYEEDGSPFTAHTTNPVPFLVISKQYADCKLHEGRLADIAPTMLKILGLPKPEAMTGESIIL